MSYRIIIILCSIAILIHCKRDAARQESHPPADRPAPVLIEDAPTDHTVDVSPNSEASPINPEPPQTDIPDDAPTGVKKVVTGANEPVRKSVDKSPHAPATKQPAPAPVNKKTVPTTNKANPATDGMAPMPRIKFEEPTHTFDTLIQGESYEHKFYFKNMGDAPLNIERAVPGCGCTVPSFPFESIAPGEKGYIGVNYISVGKEGPQKPDIIIYSDDPVYSAFTIYLQGYVKPKPEIELEEGDHLTPDEH